MLLDIFSFQYQLLYVNNEGAIWVKLV